VGLYVNNRESVRALSDGIQHIQPTEHQLYGRLCNGCTVGCTKSVCGIVHIKLN